MSWLVGDGFDVATVGGLEGCGEGFAHLAVDGVAVDVACEGGVAGSAEVVGVGELEVVVGPGGDGGAGAGGVEGDAVCGLDLVGDDALYVGDGSGHRVEVAADGGSGGEAGLAGDGLVVGVFGVQL